MALQSYALKALLPYIRKASVLSLSYPDILATKDQIEEIVGYIPQEFTDHGKGHGIERPLVETLELFHAVGASLRCIDIARLRGIEDIVDLNEPQDLGQYDLVINPGTLEHVFNIGVGMMNASNAVKVGGRIYHEMPLAMLNHGFYNICPTMLYDFYTQNKWEIEKFLLMTNKGVSQVSKDYAVMRSRMPEVGHTIFLARRTSDAKLIWPTQYKYLKMIK